MNVGLVLTMFYFEVELGH
uniref:Uncharacterized protein n=1 Tax=Rhizophora mucronata TaxID=61149 RepID=A0A2P2KH25_RHIMU